MSRRLVRVITLGVALSVIGMVIHRREVMGQQEIDFNRDIRPILSDRCWACHGPDAGSRKLKLRLDSEAAALADLGGGRRAIHPGHPDESELIRRVHSTDEWERMPPVSTGPALTTQEKDLLREWIRQGAKWQQHWAFLPPTLPAVPSSRLGRDGQVREEAGNPIDAFVRQRWERAGLEGAPEADRLTLLRRVTLDLTGLPPTRSEAAAFLQDRSPSAFERVVDRLLASPRYGERMAFRWLDVARYADTSGYQSDRERQMWRWRDWVIESFNRNQRWDDFAVEQLAGDLLPGATLDQRVATGFNRNHRGNSEAGIIAEEYAVEYAIDRVDTMATAFLGLTAGCARCHNHKYDPLSQREYYQLYAYFNSIPENGIHLRAGNTPPILIAPTSHQQRQMTEIDRRIAALERQLQRRERELLQGQRQWERRLTANDHWYPREGLVTRFDFESRSKAEVHGNVGLSPGITGQALALDGSSELRSRVAASWTESSPLTISVWVKPDKQQEGALLTLATDVAEKRFGNETEEEQQPWIDRGLGLFLTPGGIKWMIVRDWGFDSIRVETKEPLQPGRWYHIAARYDGRLTSEGVSIYLNGQPQQLKVERSSIAEPFQIQTSWLVGGAESLNRRQFTGQIDELRVFDLPLKEQAIARLADARSLLALKRAGADDVLRSAFRAQLATVGSGSTARLLRQAEELRRQRERIEAEAPSVMVMEELPQPRPAYVLRRGSYDAPGEPVTRGVPAILPPLPPLLAGGAGAPSNRLGLARWLVQPDHPLFARVTVNRFWQMFFGVGLVKTAEDFGSQGEWPSHPALLDWLAVTFARGNLPGALHPWDVKSLIRVIVTSATYRQSSRVSAERLAQDPENRLLARAPRLRLPAEMIRDQALFASGLLVEKLGGPSVKPYQPAGLWEEMSSSGLAYQQDHGDKLYRRSLYTYWKRTIAPPLMANFDGATRDTCSVRETRTNTPLQSLHLMNDPTFLEAARFLALRSIREGGVHPASRLTHAFRLVLTRDPQPRELRVLTDNLRSNLAAFRADPESAQRFLRVGEKTVEPLVDLPGLAAYSVVASLILNLDQSQTRE
ncbi:MAG: DUF1553 domain-containing protein [Blastocatellia bacterium]